MKNKQVFNMIINKLLDYHYVDEYTMCSCDDSYNVIHFIRLKIIEILKEYNINNYRDKSQEIVFIFEHNFNRYKGEPLSYFKSQVKNILD